MKRFAILGVLATLGCAVAWASTLAAPGAKLRGHYLETRTCDVYTGSCVANGEMNITGKEAMLVWSVSEGAWDGVSLDGLSVIAAVRTDGTMGDQRYTPQQGRAALIVDARASAAQREALAAMAKSLSKDLIAEVVSITSSPIEARLGSCDGSGCASVVAGDLVNISTRCFGGKDHLCGNESTFYPPLTAVDAAYPVYTKSAAYQGDALGVTWEATEQRGTFLARFEH